MKNIKNIILVCITIQENSKRLIKKGSDLAKLNNGDLHILHIEKGMSIFEQPNAALLLEQLFELGKELGGEVHFVSDNEVMERIIKTSKDLGVTHLVLGQTMENSFCFEENVIKKLEKEIKGINLVVLDRKK